MEHCFDEGTIQAFLDGELDGTAQESVARHVALCDACARLLDEAEQDSALAFAALETEFNSLVPTERIRTSLYEKIAEIEKPRKSLWGRLSGGFAFGKNLNFNSPAVAAFASLVLIVGVLAVVFINRPVNDERAVVDPLSSSGSLKPALPNSSGTETIQQGTAGAPDDKVVIREIPRGRQTISNEPARAERIKFTPGRESRREQKRGKTVPQNPGTANPTIIAKEPYLLGEESYIKTIATLTEQVDQRKDEVLKPSARIAYEKDMAVVNDAIKKMRQEVRRNPNNEAARQVLRTTYQTKIDLLNSVADKTELMAALD